MKSFARIICIVSAFLIFVFIVEEVMLNQKKLDIVIIDPIEYNVVVDGYLTKEDAIMLVNNHFKEVRYKLIWYDDKTSNVGGYTNPFFQVVHLQERLNWWNIISTLTHELCHIKYFASDETFVEFMTFKELYESGNYYLHKRAEGMIVEHCSLRAYKGTEYDIGYYVINYLGGINNV